MTVAEQSLEAYDLLMVQGADQAAPRPYQILLTGEVAAFLQN